MEMIGDVADDIRNDSGWCEGKRLWVEYFFFGASYPIINSRIRRGMPIINIASHPQPSRNTLIELLFIHEDRYGPLQTARRKSFRHF